MAIAVDTDTVPAAPQPVTSTQDIAESLVSAASDVVAKEGQDAGTSDAQLLTDNDNGATSLSKAEEPDVANVVPDAEKLEDSNTVEIEDNGLKKFDDDHVVAVKDADIANSISTNGMTNTDSQKINNVTRTSTSEETPEAFVTEVSPSTQESTLSMKPTSCDTIETEIASGLTVNSNPSIPTVVEGEAPVMEQQGAQTITDTSSYVNGKITKLDPAEEDDTQVELVTEKVANADLGNAEKEATSLKSKGVEDKTAGSDVKEEAAMEIKTDVSHVESAIPKINIQIEEAPETINVVSPNVDDSPIAVQVVAPTPALVDNRQLEESDTENTDIPEKFHAEATSTDTILFEDVITEGTATPRAKPEVKESTEEKVGVKEEAVENESLEVTPSATDEVYLIKEEMSTSIAEAPANAAEETPAVDKLTANESVETAAEEVSAVNFTPDAVEEHISVQERDPTQVESVAEEVVAAADFPLVEEKPVIDEAAIMTESKTVSTDNMASVSIPEMQFTQEDLEVPVTVPVQDKSTIDEVVATETESISKAAPLTIAEPQPVQDAPSDSAVIAAFKGQHTEEDVSHTATVDGVQTSQPPTIEESNDTTKIMHELVPPPPGDLTPEPAAEAVVTHEIPAAEEIVITQEEIVETVASQEEVVDATDSKNVLTEPIVAEATVDFEAHVEVTEEQFVVTGEIPVTREGRRDGADVRVAEEPVLEKPAKEEPVIEEFTKGEPVLEEPVNELSVVEVSVKEEPASEEPVNEPSVVEQLVKEEPIVEEPTKELPALSVKEESALEELTKGEPVLDKPVNEPSVVEVSVKEKPALEEPVKEEPVLEESVNKPPVVEEPVKKELIAEQIYPQEEPVPEPAKEEPVTVICIGEPVKEELVPGEVPMIEESIAKEPVKEEPWVDEFAREESVIKVSTTEKAVIKDSMKEEPVTEGVPTKEESVVEELEDEPIAEVLLKSGTTVEVADKDELIAEELTGKEPTIEELTQEEHVIETPAKESVVEEIPAKEEHGGEELITKGDHAVGGRASMAKFVVEEVSEKGDFAVEEPVKEEPLAEELAKAQPIVEAVGKEPVKEFAKEQLVAEKVLAVDESAAGIPTKEEPDAEDTPAKEESIVEELPVAEEPVEGELIIETRKEGCELAGLVAEVAPGESAGYEEVVEEFSVSATAANELIPIIVNTPIEHVEHGVIEPIPAKETPAVEILAAQEISVGQATSASPQPVEDVELSSTGELETKAKESVLDGAVADVAIPILEEERSAEASDKSTAETAIDQSTTASAPVVQATEESVAPAVSVPLTQDTLNVDKTDSNALFTISPAEPGHGSAVATVDEPRAHEQVVAYDLSDHDAVEFIGDKPVVLPRLISSDPATESVKITSRVDDSAPEDTPTEKLVAANEKSPTVSLTESPSDESVLIAEISVADTTTETIMVPEFNEEKKEVDMVSVVEEISIADGVGTFMPEEFILKIPDDSIQVERPWTPSFQVTTIGHGISLPAEEVIPTQALDDTENVKPARPEIMVDVSPSDIVIEAAQPPAETDESGSATLSWTPSYSVHSQGSPSPNHAPLEQATAFTEQENTRIISDTYVAQTPSDADKTIVYPSISEATEIKDVELIQDQDVQVIKDSSHEEQEPEAAVVASQVVERQEVECESLAQEPVQDESEPCYEAPTELHIEPEVTQKPFIAQVSSPMPPLEQDHPVSSSSPFPEQLSLPDTKPAEIVTTETLEESLTMENGISQVGVESMPPTVELNDSQPKDTQEEPGVDNHPSASWTYSCSVTEQGGDILEEAQLGTLVKGDLSIDREPRHSLSEEIEGSSGFSTAALIGAGVFGNAASAAHATLQKSTSFKSAEELANTSMDSDAISSGSRQENFFPALEIPDENRSHTSSSLRPLDENNTLDLSSSLSPDVYPLSSRKRLESTSSRLLPGGWFSGTSKIPDERTSLEVARGIFTGTKQAPVEETLVSPTVGPDSLVCEQSSDKRRCLIM